MNQYQDRYVAFIDILGFSALIDRAEKKPELDLLGRLASILEEVRGYIPLGTAMDVTAENTPNNPFKDMFRMSAFSDCIVISTKAELFGLSLITTICGIICNRMLHQGVFTRGAISKGKLIHTDQVVMGSGLINSYKLENSTAIYPRILLDEILLHDLAATEGQGGSLNIRRQDFDGLWHLHIFHPLFITVNSNTAGSNHENLNNEYMNLGRKEIELSLHTTTNLSIKAKATWLARYFNEHAESFGLEKISL